MMRRFTIEVNGKRVRQIIHAATAQEAIEQFGKKYGSMSPAILEAIQRKAVVAVEVLR